MSGWSSLGVVAVGLLVLGTAHGVGAQQVTPPASAEAKTDTTDDIRLTRALIQAERQVIVSQAMDLTPAEMETFWPVYRNYRLEAAKLGDQLVALILEYADAYGSLTDTTADKLLTDYLRIEQARVDLRMKFLPDFKKVLPATKVARFYQIENRLDLAILSEISETIPLAR